MTWIKEKLLWIVGGIIALYLIYIKGKKDFKNETATKLLKQCKKSKRVDSMSFNDLVKRMQEFDDK